MKPFEAYLKAKRQMVGALDYRIEKFKEDLLELTKDGRQSSKDKLIEFRTRVDELELVRNFVRNGMLWEVKNETPDNSEAPE